MTSKSDSIGVTCTRLWHFADTFSQWNSCWKKLTLGHVTENKCGYQMHIFVTSFSAQHAHAWRCFCMVQPLRQPFRPKCTNRILQMHHQNPVVPPESGAHQQNPVCTYSVIMRFYSDWISIFSLVWPVLTIALVDCHKCHLCIVPGITSGIWAYQIGNFIIKSSSLKPQVNSYIQ